MKRMSSAISLHGNPIFDALSRKHYPQILQVGNENGDLPIVEMLGPSAYEEGGQYYATDVSESQNGDTAMHAQSDSMPDEVSETEIILESLLSLGVSNALEIESIKHQASMFNHPPSLGTPDSESCSLTRIDGVYASGHNNQFATEFASSFLNEGMDVRVSNLFDEHLFMQNTEGYFYTPATSVIYPSLPPVPPPGISTDNERKFLHHYLHVISARITSPDRGKNNPFRSSFARLATDFPPLLHGILAISAADMIPRQLLTKHFFTIKDAFPCSLLL